MSGTVTTEEARSIATHNVKPAKEPERCFVRIPLSQLPQIGVALSTSSPHMPHLYVPSTSKTEANDEATRTPRHPIVITSSAPIRAAPTPNTMENPVMTPRTLMLKGVRSATAIRSPVPDAAEIQKEERIVARRFAGR